MYNDYLNQSIGYRSGNLNYLNRRRKINPLASDDSESDSDNERDGGINGGDHLKDFEFGVNGNLETPKSFRQDNSMRFSTRKTTIKVPLRNGDEEGRRVSTPTVMERLTKYRSRNGTPLRTSSGRKPSLINDNNVTSPASNQFSGTMNNDTAHKQLGNGDNINNNQDDNVDENSNIIDREREDALIKQRKLISDDNKFSPNQSSTKLFKTTSYHNSQNGFPNNSSPTKVHSRSFNDVDQPIRSPPSNLKVRPLDFDKLNEKKDSGNSRKLLFEDHGIKKNIVSTTPSQVSFNGNVSTGLAEAPRENGNKRMNDKPDESRHEIEFDSSEDESPDKVSMKPQASNLTNRSASPNIDMNIQQAPQPQPPLQTRVDGVAGVLPQTQSSLSLPPQPQPQTQPMPGDHRRQTQNQDHGHVNDPTSLENNFNHFASSVEVESVSTNGIGLDKGSLHVGLPSRSEMNNQNDMQHLETLERINVTMGDNGSTRISFDDNKGRNRRNGINALDGINNQRNHVNEPISEINKINNAMDLESDISSDDNPVELLNELNSFLPSKSSPSKTSEKISLNQNYYSNSNAGRSSTVRYSRDWGVNGPQVSHRQNAPPEMTPIRKHYSRLSDKYARHLMNKQHKVNSKELKRRQVGESSEPYGNPTVPELLESSNEVNQPWTGRRWHKLNKLLMCDSLKVDDIINSEILVSHLGCKSMAELKQRVEFLIKFNELRKMSNKISKRDKLL